MSFPTPIGRQREVLYLPAKGHVAVLGTAGSGKTTLAILRAEYLSRKDTSHSGNTLLVTFNRTLVTYLKFIRTDLNISFEIENYHLFARGYLSSRGQMRNNAILKAKEREQLITEVLSLNKANNASLFRRPLDFFSEEFRWIAQNGITSLSDYQAAQRIGRSNARLERTERDLMFNAYQQYKKLRTQQDKGYDWDDLATSVSEEFIKDKTPRLYKHIIIDEGQDFSPEMIRSLANAIPSDGSLTFFGDVAQQIYGHRISWRSAGLNIRRVWNFQENYRNSRQIAKLGIAISEMPFFKDTVDLVEPIEPTADGPAPTLVHCSSSEKEIQFVAQQAISLGKFSSIALLFRDRRDESLVSKFLPISSIRLHKDLKKWRDEPGIYYGTYHSAKGLEFDTVIMPFCSKKRIPDPLLISTFGLSEATTKDSRLIYVGVTRAKTRLIITYTEEVTEILPKDQNLYQKIKYE